MKYTIVIKWSEEDQCFIVFLPEFDDVMQPVTHGETYEEALKNAQEVLELLTKSSLEEGDSEQLLTAMVSTKLTLETPKELSKNQR